MPAELLMPRKASFGGLAPFAALAVGFLLFGVWPTLHEWWGMQGWQQTRATLIAVELQTHPGSDSTTYFTTTRYSYQFAGRE